MQNKNISEPLTIEEAALILNKTRPMVLALVDRGKIKAYKDNAGLVKVTRQELGVYIDGLDVSGGMAKLSKLDQELGLYD